MAWVLVDPLIMLPSYWRVFAKIELSPKVYIAALWPALSGTALMAAVVLAVRAVGGEWSVGVRLVAQIGAGGLTYGLAHLVLHRQRLTAFRDLVKATRREPGGDS
jgi:hypothetical protein